MPRFTVIPGSPPPDTPKQCVIDRIKKHPKPAAMIQCHRCGCREVLELKTGVLYQDGRATGGTKAIVCAHCFMKGERVVLA
jgi:hypothetical protein